MADKTKNKELAHLNPDIKEVQIGTRRLYSLTIYPLSFGQQFEFSDIITKAAVQFYETGKDLPNIAVVAFIVDIIKNNAGKILDYVTDSKEVKGILTDAKETTLLNLLSNKQVISIAEIIYDDNYEAVSKKVADLFGRMIDDHLSERSSASSSEDTPNTDLPIYSASPTEKGGLQ